MKNCSNAKNCTMVKNRRAVGTGWEKSVAKALQQRGYQILEYNYRCRTGEIDFIAKDGDYLVFCEVKFRDNARTEHPLEAVDIHKQRIISRTALHYIQTNHMTETPCRFDVIGVLEEEMIVVQNAFDFQW